MGARGLPHKLNRELLVALEAGNYRQFPSGEHEAPDRYMSEFEYRFNNRKDVDIFIKTIARMCGISPMRYKELTAQV
jgi:hypothetical protein